MKKDTFSKMRDICQTYQQHLQQLNTEDKIGQEKLAIMNQLLNCSTPQSIAELLSEPNNQRILKQRRTSYIWSTIEILLIVLIFPLAVPLLMLWSWITRGEVDFFKSNGAIVVEKLLNLSTQNTSQPNTTPSTALVSMAHVPAPPHPHFMNIDGFKLTSAISYQALKQLGFFTMEHQPHITTTTIKKLYKKAILATHPDKTNHDSSAAFLRVQHARQMLLEEEYNPDESAEQRSSRQGNTLVSTILPLVQEEQEKNIRDLLALEIQVKQLQETISKLGDSKLQTDAPTTSENSLNCTY